MANNVSTGAPKITGAVFVAPAGSTLPTDATTALDAAFVSVGEISEDGVTRTRSTDSSTIKNWNQDPVLTVQTSYEETFQFTMISSRSVNALKAAYGDDNVTGTDDKFTVKHNGAAPAEHAWVIDMVMTDGSPSRIVIPKAKVTKIGDVTYKKDEAIGFETTITAVLDDDGNTSYDYVGKAA